MPQIAVLEEEKKDDDDKKESDTLEMKDIVRGEYENKIRTFSSIEKRFLIFAKIKKFGDYKMTYFQYLDSLVPFQYIKTKNAEEVTKDLMDNRNFLKIMQKVDINGDGFINFEEFIILSVFMTLQSKEFYSRFPKGKITREQLSDFLMEEISRIESLKITSKSMIDGRVIKTDYNTLYTFMVDFVQKAFSKDINVDIKDISQFQFELFVLQFFYEFYRIPQSSQNKISNENFARVLMSYVNIYKNKHFKKKIENKLVNLDGETSFDEYLCFFWFLRQLHREKLDIFKNGQLGFAEFRKLADEKMKSLPDAGFKMKKSISDNQLRIMIELFDENGDGNLDFSEVNDILKRRVFYANSKNDFKQESRSIGEFFMKGINFIKDNLWFLK